MGGAAAYHGLQDMEVPIGVLSAFISRPTVLLVWNFDSILYGIYKR
jgi:hypothetical protein